MILLFLIVLVYIFGSILSFGVVYNMVDKPLNKIDRILLTIITLFGPFGLLVSMILLYGEKLGLDYPEIKYKRFKSKK